MKIAVAGIRGIPARYGGFETCAERTAERFSRDHDVLVFCRKHNADPGMDRLGDVQLVSLGSIDIKQLDTLSHTFRCVLWLATRGRDVELVHLYNGANAVFVPLMRLLGKRVVVSVDALEWKRDKWGALGKAYHWTSAWFCTKTANAVVTDSPVVQQYYRERFGAETTYIPYGGDVPETADPGILEGYGLDERGYLLFVGRLVPEKGVEQLLEAYGRLENPLPLVIVGDDRPGSPYVAELQRRAPEGVRFLGYVYGEDYDALNQSPYAYVTPSKLEGTSPALVAAMAAGNCVVVNGIPENRATVGDAGLVFAENDVDDLARQLDALIRDPDLAADYRRRAAERARTEFSWDAVADRYLELFASLTNGGDVLARDPGA